MDSIAKVSLRVFGFFRAAILGKIYSGTISHYYYHYYYYLFIFLFHFNFFRYFEHIVHKSRTEVFNERPVLEFFTALTGKQLQLYPFSAKTCTFT